jgi:L-alanine-DL-glutamate epimerase-like enolase superfamily enzyme
MDLELVPLTLRLREPLPTAFGTVATRELLVVRLRDADGTVGVGEAAPLEPYDGVALADVHAELASLRPRLAAADGASLQTLTELARAGCTLPQARSALDLAAWDLEGRRTGRSVAGLLGAAATTTVAVNATIGASDPAAAARAAADAVRSGFRCVKVKAGTPDDAARIAAVRAAVGPDVAVRIDANGAWGVAEAIAALRILAPLGIELCEEPIHGVEALRQVRDRSPGIPIAMDETGATPAALTAGATDLVCLKLARCGGISGVLDVAEPVRKSGAELYLASTLDGPTGIAAALHVAAALGPMPACGLATLGLFGGMHDPLPAAGGGVAVPTGPGLGARTRFA